MVTKNQIKLVKSLQQKKYRSQHKLFVVEGKKVVEELLESGLKPYKLFVEDEKHIDYEGVELISSAELRQMSSLSTPNGVLGVFYMADTMPVDHNGWVVALDSVRDPGNLGTIIRLCDWFGIKHLICSLDTVDCYNPKVLQATMGSITRVNVVYTNLMEYFEKSECTIYGTFMDGQSVYDQKIQKNGILVMGNEANGISKEVEATIDQRTSIPQYGQQTTESLNVATATAILLGEIRRRE
ncbi:TrmH family RNA methyltransferase [Flagellimonas onchidii]|uniref:TrmH family RNA methyltransferase n=1 Tax=Flagellimonas onchidii TaxID=2562684 RepID=UPI0010A6ADAA|nr:RNA methyltransferase [Allomuricauda onchidii]